MKSRSWCFTINNYTDRDIASVLALDAVYVCYQKEIAPTTGTPHLQCYVYFKNQRAMQRGLGHWEKANGTPIQNKTYCSKEGGTDFWEKGELPMQGARMDLLAIKRKLDEGTSTTELMQMDFESCSRHIKFFDRYVSSIAQPRDFKTKVNWYWGPTGTGKSRLAALQAGDGAYWKNDTKWWCGYQSHENVIIDDMRAGHFTFNALLRLLDRYPLKVELKGATVEFVARTVWITCPYHPEKLYEEREDIAQLIRRIDNVREFKNGQTIIEFLT